MLHPCKKCFSDEVNRARQVWSGTCKHHWDVMVHVPNASCQAPSPRRPCRAAFEAKTSLDIHR